MGTRPGIPTTYESSNFRSRLEARWAAFFDLIGWQWTYEPLDASGYIPDFLIHGSRPMFVEVGPLITLDDYIAKSHKADMVAHELAHDVLVVGVSPLAIPATGDPWRLFAGWLGEYYPGSESLSWDRAIWAMGGQGLGVYHMYDSYAHRPHGDGHEQSLSIHARYGTRGLETGSRMLERLWREAGNTVQWRAA